MAQTPSRTLYCTRSCYSASQHSCFQLWYSDLHGWQCSYDTKLTNSGKEEAKRAMHEAGQLQPAPQILLSSPLSRALQTADLAFAKFQGPREAVSLAREKTYFASDVGVPRFEIVKYIASVSHLHDVAHTR